MNKDVGHIGMPELRLAVQEARQYASEVERLRRAAPIIAERDRQDEKWGPQDHTLPEWVSILVKEVGELAAATQGHLFGTANHPDLDWRKEAIQVAAVALAMVEEYKEPGDNDD